MNDIGRGAVVCRNLDHPHLVVSGLGPQLLCKGPVKSRNPGSGGGAA